MNLDELKQLEAKATKGELTKSGDCGLVQTGYTNGFASFRHSDDCDYYLALRNAAPELIAKIERLRDRCERLKQACARQDEEISQTLGKSLGYPWFKDDQKNFPGADESCGVCVGDHVAETLAMEAATEIERLRKENERLKEWEPRLLPLSSPKELVVSVKEGFLSRLVESLDAMNGDANYTVTQARCGDTKYEIVVRRADKPTPHELRKKAEAELAEAKAEIARLHARIDELDTHVGGDE